MYNVIITDEEIHRRLDALVKRRNVNLTDNVRFRKLHTSKWNMWQAAQKSELLTNLDRNLRDQ